MKTLEARIHMGLNRNFGIVEHLLMWQLYEPEAGLIAGRLWLTIYFSWEPRQSRVQGEILRDQCQQLSRDYKYQFYLDRKYKPVPMDNSVPYFMTKNFLCLVSYRGSKTNWAWELGLQKIWGNFIFHRKLCKILYVLIWFTQDLLHLKIYRTNFVCFIFCIFE